MTTAIVILLDLRANMIFLISKTTTKRMETKHNVIIRRKNRIKQINMNKKGEKIKQTIWDIEKAQNNVRI